jgi:hypothetical protein
VSEQKFAASQGILASFGPLLFLPEIAMFDAYVANLVLDNGIRHSKACRVRSGSSVFEMLADLTQTLQERYHGTVKITM